MYKYSGINLIFAFSADALHPCYRLNLTLVLRIHCHFPPLRWTLEYFSQRSQFSRTVDPLKIQYDILFSLPSSIAWMHLIYLNKKNKIDSPPFNTIVRHTLEMALFDCSSLNPNMRPL